MQTHKKTLTLFFTVLLVLATLAILPALASPITVATEKDEYKAGEVLAVSGTATPNALVSIQLFDPNGKRVAITQADADSTGAYSATNIYTFSKEDTTGTWTVKAYDSAADKWAETTFTLTMDVTPPTLTITISPTKATYKEETITITVTSNEELKAPPVVTVTQAGATPVEVTMTKTADLTWTGEYTIVAGHDGTATIKATAEDVAGNTGTATAEFTVEVTPAWQEPLTNLENKMNSKINSLNTTINNISTQVKNLADQVATLSGAVTIAYVAIVLGLIGIIIGIVALIKKPRVPTPT